MADLIIIPYILMILIGMKHTKEKMYYDYMSIDATTQLKGICAISIVLLHIGGVVGAKVLPEISAFAVSVFFFISGYGIITQYKLKKDNYIKGFLPKHIIKLCVPYLVASIIYYCYFAYATNHFGYNYYDNYKLSIKSVISAFFDHGYTIVVNSWFVIVIIIVYISFYFCAKLSKNIENTLRYITTIIVLLTVAFFILSQYRGWISAYYMQTLCIIVGMYYAYKKERIDRVLERHRQMITSLFAIVLFVGLLSFATIKYNAGDMGGTFNTVEYLVMGPIIALSSAVAFSGYKIGCSRVWKFLGEISYELYLIHGIFYYIFQLGRLRIENKLLFTVVVISCAIVCAAILHIIDKYIVKCLFVIFHIKKNTKEKSVELNG